MKILALTSLLAVFAFTGAHAATNNYFVGGAAQLSLDSGHSTILSVTPEIGYKYNADWDIGMAAHFGYDHGYLSRTYGVEGETYSYGVGAFARYKVAQFGGVKLLLKGAVGMNFVTLSPDDDDIDAETLKVLNASVIPMITYDISESFTLYANLNFLGLNANYTFKNKDMGVEDSWRISAAADSANVADTGKFQIGFNYNF